MNLTGYNTMLIEELVPSLLFLNHLSLLTSIWWLLFYNTYIISKPLEAINFNIMIIIYNTNTGVIIHHNLNFELLSVHLLTFIRIRAHFVITLEFILISHWIYIFLTSWTNCKNLTNQNPLIKIQALFWCMIDSVQIIKYSDYRN